MEEFAKHFDEVHVIALSVGEYQLPSNVFLYSLEKEKGARRVRRIWLFYKYFFNIFFSKKVQFVFFHMGAIFNIMAAPFWLVRKFFGTKFYWWKAHGHINLEGKIALTFCDSVFTSTASGFPIVTKKRQVIGQAIDTNFFHFSQQSDRNTKKIIFVGRLMPVKKVEVFIETARGLQSHGYTFAIVGPISDENYYSTLKEKARGLDIEFVGPKTQAELIPIYQSAHVFLNTSQTHSMDKTVLEAALCGCLPVTNNKAFRELLEGTSLFSDESNSDAYSKVIRNLETIDSESLRRELSDRVALQHRVETLPERIFGQ